MKTKEQINFSILEILDEEGVSIAFTKIAVEAN